MSNGLKDQGCLSDQYFSVSVAREHFNGRLWYDYFCKDDGTIDHQSIDGYDAFGRTWVKRQVFFTGSQWYHYESRNTYNLAGNVLTQQYPSGRTVNFTYDAAARTATFSGNIGDGTTRTYISDVTYNSRGQTQEERFGTTPTALYHKLRYNVRGQLYDVRLSTMSQSVDAMNWNRGCLTFFYSTQGGWVWGGSGTDNNGNVCWPSTGCQTTIKSRATGG